MILVDERRRPRMSVAVTFCDHPEYEGRQDKQGYPFFRGSEAESLPKAIESGAPVRLQLRFQLTTNGHEWLRRFKPYHRLVFIRGCLFLPRSDRNRAVMSSDIRIVEPRF
jgi:hypothetical protein